MQMLLESKIFDWINKVNEILSKSEITIKKEGNKIMSEYDVILSYLSTNLSVVYSIPETKHILSAYIKVMERLANLAKQIFYILSYIDYRKQIIIKDGETEKEYYFNPYDNSFWSMEQIKILEDTYKNVMEAFRQLGRKYIFTLVAGLELQHQEAFPQHPYQEYPQQQGGFEYPSIGGGLYRPVFTPPRKPEEEVR